MSNWSNTQLTAKGQALDAKVTAGLATLTFTKMKLGSGTETAADIPAMTDLSDPKMILGISSCAVSEGDPTICEVISIASSADVVTSFTVSELGIFATDPDDGEILYAVMLDSVPDVMPNQSVASPVTVTYQVNIMSANAASISAIIDPAGLVSVTTMNAAINAHNTGASSHPITIDDTVAPTSDSAPMPTILNNIATMLKSISGESGWKSVPAKSLAALASSLSTGITVAADGTFSNPTLGITGLMAQNGYICFGPNFGGLILQWGHYVTTNGTCALPISFTSAALVAVNTNNGTNTGANTCCSVNLTTIKLYASSNADHAWIAIGV